MRERACVLLHPQEFLDQGHALCRFARLFTHHMLPEASSKLTTMLLAQGKGYSISARNTAGACLAVAWRPQNTARGLKHRHELLIEQDV